MLSVDIGESNTLNERTLRMHAISHFPIENRKASMDCLEGQSKVAENLEQEIIKDASLPLRKSLKSCLQYPFHVS